LFRGDKCTFIGRKNKGAPTYSDEIPVWSVEIVGGEKNDGYTPHNKII
jgi:hypothetical protein